MYRTDGNRPWRQHTAGGCQGHYYARCPYRLRVPTDAVYARFFILYPCIALFQMTQLTHQKPLVLDRNLSGRPLSGHPPLCLGRYRLQLALLDSSTEISDNAVCFAATLFNPVHLLVFFTYPLPFSSVAASYLVSS